MEVFLLLVVFDDAIQNHGCMSKLLASSCRVVVVQVRFKLFSGQKCQNRIG